MTSRSEIIVGIDPGLKHTGYALLTPKGTCIDYGVTATSTTKDTLAFIKKIHSHYKIKNVVSEAPVYAVSYLQLTRNTLACVTRLETFCQMKNIAFQTRGLHTIKKFLHIRAQKPTANALKKLSIIFFFLHTGIKLKTTQHHAADAYIIALSTIFPNGSPYPLKLLLDQVQYFYPRFYKNNKETLDNLLID